MIKLELDEVLNIVRHHERTLAAVRKVVVEQGYDREWIDRAVSRAAQIRQDLAKVIKVKGNVMVVKRKR